MVALLVEATWIDSLRMPIADDALSLISCPRRLGIVSKSSVMRAWVVSWSLKKRHRVIRSSSIPVAGSLVSAIGYPTGGVMAAAEAPAWRVKVDPRRVVAGMSIES